MNTSGISKHPHGGTRSRRATDHLLQTPDTFVWAPLPGMDRAVACVHISPALGADFAQYTVAIEVGGSWSDQAATSRFVYVIEGKIESSGQSTSTLQANDFLYFPPASPLRLSSSTGTRMTVIEKQYIPLAGVPEPAPLRGSADQIPATPLMGDEAIQVRALLPADPRFDFAVNLLTYQPGARLGLVEVHVMEHGLLMLQGEGVYRLGDSWYPVAAGDFIWMAPFCPQWFGALGAVPSTYLIYKDWNRAPLAAASHR